MSDPPTLPPPQYTLIEAIGICLAMCERCVTEVRALSLLPGPPGMQGERGMQGAIGPAGERGLKGEAGRNASDLALLQQGIEERIDAQFKASSVTTDDGGRTLKWSVAGQIHEVKTAVVLDAGIWKDGNVYVAGDGVTHGGSWWIAKQETAEKPGKSDAWRLAVKRGNDGRDYRGEEDKRSGPVRFK